MKTPRWVRSVRRWLVPASKQITGLPDWATTVSSPRVLTGRVAACIEVDSEAAYKKWLKLLAVERIDQYWLEVAYQCAKMDVQAALVGTDYDPRLSGKPVEINFLRCDKYALRHYPEGDGITAAAQGLGARGHYKRLRGAVPF